MHFSAKKSYSPRFLLHRSGMVSLCSRSSSDNKRPLRTGASVWAQIPPPEQPKALLFCEISPHKRPDILRLLQQCQSPHNGSGNYTPVSDILAFPEIHLLFFHILYRSFAGFFILQSPFGSDLLPVLTDFYTKCPIKLLLWISVGPSV